MTARPKIDLSSLGSTYVVNPVDYCSPPKTNNSERRKATRNQAHTTSVLWGIIHPYLFYSDQFTCCRALCIRVAARMPTTPYKEHGLRNIIAISSAIMLSEPTWKVSCTKVDCDLPSSMCDSDSWIKTGSSFDPCAGLGFISKKSGAELNFVI